MTLLPSNVVPTAVPLLRQEWDTTDAELGGVFTAYRQGYLAAVLMILPLTDRFRASYVIGDCSAVAALASPLALIATWRISPPPSHRASFNPAVMKDGPPPRTILAYGAHSWELYISKAWLPAFLAAVLVGQGLGEVEAASEGARWAGLIAGPGTAGVWIGGWLSDRWGRAQVAVTIAFGSGVLSLLSAGSAWSAGGS